MEVLRQVEAEMIKEKQSEAIFVFSVRLLRR